MFPIPGTSNAVENRILDRKNNLVPTKLFLDHSDYAGIPAKIQLLAPVPGNNILVAGDGGVNNASAPTEMDNWRIRTTGVFRIFQGLRLSIGPNNPAYCYVARNGVQYGPTHSTGNTYVLFSDDLYFEAGDTCQIFLWSLYGSGDQAELSNTSVGQGIVDSNGPPLGVLYVPHALFIANGVR